MPYDVLIVGGGPSGLAAALTLGRATKGVLLCDAGPRRNASATRIHNVVTRDGTPPDAFRRIAREQLAAYPRVEIRDTDVRSISGERGSFVAVLGDEVPVEARRVLLCTGMIDEMLPIDGFRERWGHAIYQCPFCHGWEVKGQRWGYLVSPGSASHFRAFALQLHGWTRDVVVFTDGRVDLSAEDREHLAAAGIQVHTSPVTGLRGEAPRLSAVELADGTKIACTVVFAHPPQRQVDLVRTLGVALDDQGYVRADPMSRESSISGVYAAGDLTTRMQAVTAASALGVQAAAMINVELTTELVLEGAL